MVEPLSTWSEGRRATLERPRHARSTVERIQESMLPEVPFASLILENFRHVANSKGYVQHANAHACMHEDPTPEGVMCNQQHNYLYQEKLLLLIRGRLREHTSE